MPTIGGRLVWPASLSVCVAGWLIAHSLAYRLVASVGEGDGALVEHSGHGQLAFSPYVMAVSVAVLVLALSGAVVAGVARRARAGVPLAPFVLLPLVDFACHAGLEWLQHGGGVSFAAALEPVFGLGLALQLPLALAALLLVRAALAWAEGLGRGLTPRWCPRPRASAAPAPLRRLVASEHRPILPALASGCSERGPPLLILVR
jgi:hypothetical protein